MKDALCRKTILTLNPVSERKSVNVFLDDVGCGRRVIEVFAGFIEFCDSIDLKLFQRFGFAHEEIVLFPCLDRINAELFDGNVFAVGLVDGFKDGTL